MGTTGRDLTIWLLLSGIAHGLVLGALPPVWTAPGGGSSRELRVSLAESVAGREASGAPAAESPTPSEQSRPADEPGAGSASREAQVRPRRPPPGSRAEPAAEARRPPEIARTRSAAEVPRARHPSADEERTEAAATPIAPDRGTAPEGASAEAPTPAEEREKRFETAAAESAAGAALAKTTTVDEETTEVAALTAASREEARTPPKARVSASEEAQPGADTREQAPEAQASAAVDRDAGDTSDADGPRAAQEGPAASVQAKGAAQMVAAAARVSAPAFSQAAEGPGAADELLALLHREISRHKRYPLLARRQQREGEATIRFRLHPDGYVDDLSVVRSSGFRPLDDAALRAVGGVAPFAPAARFLAGAERFEVDVVFTLR